MASSKKTLDPRTETPANKVDVTKKFMELYMETIASVEDVEWYYALISQPAYRKMYTNKLDGSKYEDIDIPKVRQEFCNRFYPALNTKKKNAGDFTTRIKILLEKKRAQ